MQPVQPNQPDQPDQLVRPIEPLASHYQLVFDTTALADVSCYSPGMARLKNGRLVATLDLGGEGVAALPGSKRRIEGGKLWQGKVFVSDDRGLTWSHRADYPFMHARPFVAGDTLYILGHCNDLAIIRSDDDGETWSEPVLLTEGEYWHQAPCNVHTANDCVYLVMEKRVYHDVKGWPVSALAPVLMRAAADQDLTRRTNWTFASELVFRDAVPAGELEYFGVPFFAQQRDQSVDVGGGRCCAPIGWLETNVVQFNDPDHIWHDPTGHTFHLWMRAHTGSTGLAALAKVVEHPDGSMITELERAPSGRVMAFVPCPGGQMKFHILYDTVIETFWLLSSQAVDSMTRPDRLSPQRYGLPNNERHRLQLHFSRNCIDWCFAGLVACGRSPKQARHYASMVIADDDLLVLSRSGNEQAKTAHDGNLISLHTIPAFRRLVY